MIDPAFMDDIMKHLAHAIDGVMKDNFGEKGFCLLVFDFHKPGIANYISNARREDMIKSLRETADRLEKHQDIPPTHPTIQ